MKNYSPKATKSIAVRNCLFTLFTSLILCASFTGCTVNRVSMLPPKQSGTQVQAGDVKFLPNFHEINAPWKIEGMISAYTLPIGANSAEKRKSLIRKEAADLGINTVVGLQSLTGAGHTGLSNGILVGAERKENSGRPKFIAFLPPVNFKMTEAPSLEKLDDALREYIQFFLSYTKGYYVHRWETSGISSDRVLQGNIDSETLSQPLGVTPDFIILCDVDGYDEKGNIVIMKAQTLKISLTLLDLREKKVLWTSAGAGHATQSLLIGAIMFTPMFSWANLLTESEERTSMVRQALLETIDTLPVVPGFKPGVVSTINKK